MVQHNNDQVSFIKMTIGTVRILLTLLPVGFLLIMLSCKIQTKENISEISPVDDLISLSEAQVQLANINVEEVRKGTIGQKLSLTGVLKISEQSLITISTRTSGRIEKLYFKNTGETVKKGDKLYEFYSEDLINAQRSYVTLQSNNWNFSGRYEPSLILEDKLLVMGLIPLQIRELEENRKILFRVVIYSTVEGKIRSVNVSEGQYINTGQTLFELASDNTLWLEAQMYPEDIQYLKVGMPATVIVPGAGKMELKCKISFINPSFETGKNVTLVRAVIDNPRKNLYPGMLALLNVQAETRYGIVIPSSAVISGMDGDRVWVTEGKGGFSGRIVTTGLQSGDSVLILSGLEESDKVVTTGAYLLNSEMILKHGINSP